MRSDAASKAYSKHAYAIMFCGVLLLIQGVLERHRFTFCVGRAGCTCADAVLGMKLGCAAGAACVVWGGGSSVRASLGTELLLCPSGQVVCSGTQLASGSFSSLRRTMGEGGRAGYLSRMV